MPQPPRRARPGTGIRFPLQMWQQLTAFAVSLRIIPGPGIEVHEGVGGTTVSAVAAREFAIKITARSGADYAWTLQRAMTGGAWADDPRETGTTTRDAAREANGVATTVPQVVWARRESPGNRLVFERDLCS